MKAIITGGTGFIGTHLTQSLLQAQIDPYIVSYGTNSLAIKPFIDLDSTGLIPTDLLSDAQILINLAGEPVGQYWTTEVKERILTSRLSTTNVLIRSIQRNQQLGLPYPTLLISASAIGYYGTTTHGMQTEESPSGKGFLASVCRQWEHASLQAAPLGVRVVILRFGHVLGPGGGILKKMSLPFHWGVGGIIGSGQQYISWIHLKDLVRIILLSIKEETMRGSYNVTTTQAVTMKEFMKQLGRVLGRPSWTSLPAWVARLVMGEMAEELLLPSQHVSPNRLLKIDYPFSFPLLPEALQDIYTNPVKK